jgi:membrane-associated protease RseP (regulator of RpoE activity)
MNCLARMTRRVRSVRRGRGPAVLAAMLGILAPMLAPGAAPAQEARTLAPASPPRGWIGILYDADEQGRPALQRVGGRTGLLVREVVPGSPALAAGLRSGDILLAIDGRGVAGGAPDALQVRAGQPLLLQLLRDGRVLESRLVAAQRPPDFPSFSNPSRLARVDSLRIRIIQEMDSLLLQEQRLGESRSIVTLFRNGDGGEPTVTVLRTRDLRNSPDAVGAPRGPGPYRVEVRGLTGTGADREWTTLSRVEPREGVPFEVFVPRGDVMDGLARELHAVRGAMEALRAEEWGGQQGVLRQQEQLLAEAQRLQGGMRAEARASAPASRPLSPYLLGQRVVAGAEVTPLNPDLAGYFGGEEGLLVLQVIPGSPAAEAGFVAGDIITRMGDRRVLDVEQARAALERSPRGPIPVTLVRRGRSVLVDLPR